MAVRVRKLAKDLGATAQHLLGVLHALGFERYKSPEDMLPGPVEAKLRRGLRDGVAPVPVSLPPAASSAGGATSGVGAPDLMARLMPGVVPMHGAAVRSAGGPRKTAPPPGAVPSAAGGAVPNGRAQVAPETTLPEHEPSPRAAAAASAALLSARRALEAERAVFEAERLAQAEAARHLAARERAVEAEAVALDELRTALEREAEVLKAAKTAMQRPGAAPAEGVGLVEVLEARGLRGVDEMERALVALGQRRVLRDLLWALRVDPADALGRALADHLVLVGGRAPEGLAERAALVAVAPDRADVPDADALDRHLRLLSEHLLLNGLRRLRLVGGRPLSHRLLRDGLDERLSLSVAPGQPRTGARATEDVAAADAVILWGVTAEPEGAEVYARAGRPVFVVPAGSVVELVATLLRALAG